MKRIRLYSPTHLHTASNIWPEKVANEAWLDEKWTDSEINQVKKIEFDAWTDSEFLSRVILDLELYEKSEEFTYLSKIIKDKNVKSVKSIGSGFTFKEIALAKAFPNTNFSCDDISPIVPRVKVVIEEMGLDNVQIKDSALVDSFAKCDLVLCIAVVYCIDNLTAFSGFLRSLSKSGGYIYISHVAYLNVFTKLITILKPLKRSKTKVTGYRMDLGYLKKYLRSTGSIVDIQFWEPRLPRAMDKFFFSQYWASKFKHILAAHISILYRS